ncbi:MAG TPA: hypothetical protein VLC10_00750 [Patescibacteria group bacterium]|nr:hypothetical protein [Patescibacteria group bacterium]
MNDPIWHRVDDDASVSFTFGCDCKGHHRGRTWDLPCSSAGYAHGHARLSSDEDGECWLPFPIASQEGMRQLMAYCADWLSEAERAAFLALDAVKALPEALTEGESAILRNPERFATFHRYGFVSF